MVESAELERATAAVRERIARACEVAGRRPEEVLLIAVTKQVGRDAVRAAAAAGVEDFGENYVQELATKREAAPGARWHFIGRLQRNKARRVLDLAEVVHGLEPGAAAERLAAAASARGDPIDCLMEVDFTGRRVGVRPEQAERFADRMAPEPGIRLRGLMTVPPLGEDPRPFFVRLRKLRNELAERFEGMADLSMGMSSDLEAAVEEGATMVRVGTAIFGPRP